MPLAKIQPLKPVIWPSCQPGGKNNLWVIRKIAPWQNTFIKFGVGFALQCNSSAISNGLRVHCSIFHKTKSLHELVIKLSRHQDVNGLLNGHFHSGRNRTQHVEHLECVTLKCTEVNVWASALIMGSCLKKSCRLFCYKRKPLPFFYF